MPKAINKTKKRSEEYAAGVDSEIRENPSTGMIIWETGGMNHP